MPPAPASRFGSSASPHPPLSRMRPALGTLVAVSAGGSVEATLPAIDRAYARITALETLLHPSRDGSDVARVNRAAVGEPVTVGGALLEILRAAQALHDASAGLFDPCLPERSGSLRDLILEEGTVRLRRPVALDLGGIAKGYIVDAALEELERAGCTSGLVNAGGDLRVFGSTESILVRRGPQLLPVEVRDAALAVSEPGCAQRPGEHRGYYLRSMPSAQPREMAAVLAPTALLADALTKCVLLGSGARVRGVLARFGGRQIA